jgi:2-polyprenyl-3-methyl-5-hydroxy-6-metoxy-1,4-benzoquinol methylase
LRYEDILIATPPAAAPRLRSLWGCTRCHAYWTRLPGEIGTSEYYREKPEVDHHLLEGGLDRFRRVRRAVEAALGAESYRVLDVGCAAGAHLNIYPATVGKFGVEPARSAAEALRRRGVTWLGPSAADAPTAAFEAVTALDVLEHVEQPRPFLDELDRCVAPGGVVALVTGNIDSPSARLGGRRWLYYALPEHCSFFSARALRSYWVGERGYEAVGRTWIANQDVDAAYVLDFLRGAGREAVLKVLPHERVRAIERRGGGRFPFFCDNMLLTFRRPTQAPHRERRTAP